MSSLHVSPLAARRFTLGALGVETPFADVGAALAHLGYVQIDPLNICGRMHDLILRNRVHGYREGDLMRWVHGVSDGDDPTAAPRLTAERRSAFEHHHPSSHVLVAFGLEAWPYLAGAMQARSRHPSAWMGRLTPRERELAPRLLDEITARGPLGSEDFADARKAHRVVWGASSLVKSTLQKLFFHGRLLIAERRNNRRRYDLPERLLPAATLATPPAPAAETQRWIARLQLRQRRLAVLTRAELRHVEDLVQHVTIAGCPAVHCLRDDAARLERCAADEAGSNAPAASSPAATPAPAPSRSASAENPVVPAPIRLLAPLDPLIYDRRLTKALWHFDYTWEAYTPAAKRVRGHYALPVLAGTELVGHVEPKADRPAGKLVVASRSVRRGFATRDAVRELAGWLGLRT